MPESRRLHRLILSGFALLLLLMVGWGVHTIWHIHALEDRTNRLIQERNLKIQLATGLQEASYNRHNSLVYQVLLSDPFERDEMFQQFIKWGYEVGKARNAIRSMALDDHEILNLTRQDQLIADIVVLHDRISDLAASNDLVAARELMTEELRPLNLLFVEVVEDLRRYERDLISGELGHIHASVHDAVLTSLVLGIFLLALALAIAYITYKQLRGYSQTISDQVQLLEAVGRSLEHQANHDSLTGIPNRSLFNQRLQEDLERAGDEHYGLMLIYLDLDDFKLVNDRHGHAVGDAMLKTVAQRMKQTMRVNDTVARLGGDEFAVIFTDPGTLAQQEALIEKLNHAVCQPVYLGDIHIEPRCSIGWAIYPRDGTSQQELVNAADAHMYRIKHAGKQPPST